MRRNPSIRASHRLGRLAAVAVGAVVLVLPGVAFASGSEGDTRVEPIELRCAAVSTQDGPGAHCAWSAPDEDPAGYGLARRAHRDDRWQLVARGGSGFREHVDGPLRPGRYEYVAVAFDEAREPVGLSRPAQVLVGKPAPERDGGSVVLPVPLG
jgi:hypothetical protein